MSDVLLRRPRRLDTAAFLEALPKLCRWQMVAIALAGAWSVTLWRASDTETESAAVWLVRFATVIGVVGAVFALDDPSHDVTEASVGARRTLLPSRLAVVLGATLLAGLPAALVARDQLSAGLLTGLLLEAFAVVAVLCAVAMLLQRRWRIFEPAQFMVFAVLLFPMADQMTAGRWPLMVSSSIGWDDAHRRWMVTAAVALVALAWQLRDPAASRHRLAVPGVENVRPRR